jgi:(R,R)-butanediol dehydrogenase/meso-butanediol dehydrogenase/diacetyl reductase
MKAAVFQGAGKGLAVEDVPEPVAGEGQVVIEVARCGICGTDLHMTEGHPMSFPAGIVLGHELAGRVVALGPGVNRLKIGDLVAPHGSQGTCGRCAFCLQGRPQWCLAPSPFSPAGFAERTIAQQHALITLPSSFSLADGALVEPLACCVHGIRLAGGVAGKRVLVVGAGAIGLGTVHVAKRLGAARVAVISRSDRHAALARTLGADGVLTGPTGDSPREIEDALGGPAEIVFECVGVPGLLTQAMDLAAPRATVVVLGMCVTPDTVMPATAILKELTVRFSLLYDLEDFQAVADAFEKGRIDPGALVTETIGLSALPATFEAMRRPSARCKVLVDPSR